MIARDKKTGKFKKINNKRLGGIFYDHLSTLSLTERLFFLINPRTSSDEISKKLSELTNTF